MFEDVRQKRSVKSLPSITNPGFFKTKQINGSCNKKNKNLALEKLHRQTNYLASQLLENYFVFIKWLFLI